MLDSIVDHFGTQANLARLLGQPRSNVSTWLKTCRFPAKYLLEIERLSEGRFKAVTVSAYQDYWSKKHNN